MAPIVRIAPSPTGYVHIGTARTALFNWLFARKYGGKFLLRIEDTDKERSKREYEQSIFDGLNWLGIDWDNKELIRQSSRTDLYREHLRRLIKEGSVYEKFFSEAEKEEIRKDGRTPQDSILVLRTPDENELISFDDEIRGHIEVQARHIGDIAVAKDIDTPLYNFAAVVDDSDLGITHVIRGEEHISNTQKQILIFRALGAQMPKFAHLPLILAPDRSKMSKRHGATSVAEYQNDYLSDAFVNFMAHLGHTYSKEILTREEMIDGFDLASVHLSGAVFDQKKLDWMNAQYVRKLDPDAFRSAVKIPEIPDSAIPLITERLEKLSDVNLFHYLWDDPLYNSNMLVWKENTKDDARNALKEIGELINKNSLSIESLDELAKKDFDSARGRVYWPLRVALSGSKTSPGPLEIAGVIGKDASINRLNKAIELLSS